MPLNVRGDDAPARNSNHQSIIFNPKPLIYFSIGAQAVLGGVDARLHNRGLNLVNGFRTEVESPRNLLDGRGRQQFVVTAHGENQCELIGVIRLSWRTCTLAQTRAQEFKLLLTG